VSTPSGKLQMNSTTYSPTGVSTLLAKSAGYITTTITLRVLRQKEKTLDMVTTTTITPSTLVLKATTLMTMTKMEMTHTL
jgi:hypothetical protein